MNLDIIRQLIKDEDILILYIKSRSCSVCVELLPKVQEIASHNNIKSVDVFIEDMREVGGIFNVFSAPTIITFAMGKEVYREGRFLVPSKLEEVIHKYKNLLL